MTVIQLRTRLCIVDRHVPNSELLVTGPHSILASIEHKVYVRKTPSDIYGRAKATCPRTAHHATTTILHPETLVHGVTRGAHLELDIVQRCPLRHLPMNAGRA